MSTINGNLIDIYLIHYILVGIQLIITYHTGEFARRTTEALY